MRRVRKRRNPGAWAVAKIGEWLASLGLSEYAERFAQERVEFGDLSELTDQDLQGLGIPLGPRRRILKTIREIGSGMPGATPPPAKPQLATPTAQPAAKFEPKVHDTAERRQLTIMFCDLVGSTALSTRLDPEDLRGVIGAHHRCCAELVERHGGFVAEFLGDGVLAYFGYPRADEHDPERAVRAGLALVEAVPKLATKAGAPLEVRVGIDTGLVVVGQLIGSGESQERGVVGETPNLAARLQAAAAPGTVVIGPATRRLLGSLFEYEDLGRIEVKGFAAPVEACRVVRQSAVESRFEALRAATTPLVGRDEDIELLLRRWVQAKQGDGQVVLISGEPGIGKSRITEAVQERLSAEPHSRLRFFCSPHHQDSALYPIITHLEHTAGFRKNETNDDRLTKLETILAQATNDLDRAVPILADLLSIPTGDRYPPLNLTPQKRKERTLNALLGQIEGLGARQAVLMAFEDAHWIDPTSFEMLDLLVERASSLRVLLIVTFRPEFSAPWVGRSHVTTITLNRLPPRHRADMINSVIGGKALPKEIADQILQRTDGVPLFIEELTKAVIESGDLLEAGDRYEVAGPMTALAIPTSLHASLLARLDRLAPVRELAQIAASLGRQFSHVMITAIAGMPAEQVDDALEQLVNAGLIFRRGTPPDAEYTFKHALVQDAAYSTLLKARRRQIHARIVTKLEANFSEVVLTQPALLAQHCTEAGMTEQAIEYWLKAGQQSVARSAMTEGLVQLEKGLALASEVLDPAKRQKLELNLRITIGNALMSSKGLAAPEAGDA